MNADGFIGILVILGFGALFVTRGLLKSPKGQTGGRIGGRLIGLILAALAVIAVVTIVLMVSGLKDGR